MLTPPILQDAAQVENDFLAMHHILREDAVKMFQVMLKLVDVKTSSLIAPASLPSNQAMGYAQGSKDAFKRVGDMAQFALDQLQFDFRKLTDESQKSIPNAKKLE